MEKINFVNDSEPYLSAENLNQMQSNIENAIPTKTSQLTNDSDFGKVFAVSRSSFEEIQNYIVNTHPKGVSLLEIVINGAFSAAIVQKANEQYLSFIRFGYGVTATQYKYMNGAWEVKEL